MDVLSSIAVHLKGNNACIGVTRTNCQVRLGVRVWYHIAVCLRSVMLMWCLCYFSHNSL